MDGQVEAQEYISTCNCPDYLQRAEARLREESERVQNYLDSISEPKITSVVETELILHQVHFSQCCMLLVCLLLGLLFPSLPLPEMHGALTATRYALHLGEDEKWRNML